MASSTFRYGFFTGLAIAAALGVYLLQLWAPENQVRLHSGHFLDALEAKDWKAVEQFIGEPYLDQWQHDRATVINRLRQVLPYARNLRIEPREIILSAGDGTGEWRARIHLEADPNEVSRYLLERVNSLEEPFVLEWRQVSRKPWDWKLMRVTNPALQLPDAGY